MVSQRNGTSVVSGVVAAGHYKKAKENKEGFENFKHGSEKFEEPKNPGIVLNTDKESVEDSIDKLMTKLKEKGIVKI